MVVFVLYGPPNTLHIGESEEGAAFLPNILLIIFIGFVLHPFLRAGLIGSYVRILGKESVTFDEFIEFGRQYYRPFLILILLMIGLSIPFGLLAAIVLQIFDLPLTVVQSPSGWLYLAGGLFALAIVPFTELAPIMIVLTGQKPLKAVIESYRLVYHCFDSFFPFLVFLWGIPVVIHWMGGEMMAGTFMERWGGQLVQFFFMLIGIPTMVAYLAERIGTLNKPEKKIS